MGRPRIEFLHNLYDLNEAIRGGDLRLVLN